jgi:hypothetical protein
MNNLRGMRKHLNTTTNPANNILVRNPTKRLKQDRNPRSPPRAPISTPMKRSRESTDLGHQTCSPAKISRLDSQQHPYTDTRPQQQQHQLPPTTNETTQTSEPRTLIRKAEENTPKETKPRTSRRKTNTCSKEEITTTATATKP